MIKIFIPSYRRPTTHTTPALLRAAGIDKFHVMVRPSQYLEYVKHLPKRNITVVGENDGLNAAREVARKSVKLGEWCLHMDDNVQGFVMAEKKFYKRNHVITLEPGETMITRAKWQSTLSVPVDFKEFYETIVEDTMRRADDTGAYLAGFSAHENPAFRGKKFSDVGYVCGKMMLMRNQGLPWNQSTESSGEDYALTAAHLFDNGRVIINKWGHPKRIHYQPGGCGPYDERLPAMLRAQTELVARYGVLFGIKNVSNPEKKQGELRIRFHSVEQVAKWRTSLPGDPNLRTPQTYTRKKVTK